jgi:hypothetical protein
MPVYELGAENRARYLINDLTVSIQEIVEAGVAWFWELPSFLPRV